MRTGFAISSFCLNDMPLEMALDRLSALTDCVEIMDEGCHRLEDTAVLETFDLRYMVHAPSRGVNLASLLEPVRRASVEVTVACLALSAEVGAPVVVHPGYFAWPRDRKRAEQQFRQSLADLFGAAEDLSATFFIENMGDWEHFLLKTPDELPLIDGAGFALDVGHAHQNHVLPAFLEVPDQPLPPPRQRRDDGRARRGRRGHDRFLGRDGRSPPERGAARDRGRDLRRGRAEHRGPRGPLRRSKPFLRNGDHVSDTFRLSGLAA